MKLNKTVAGSVGASMLALGLATSAQADGYAAPGAASAPPLSWTGFYVGAQGAALWGSVDGAFSFPQAPFQSITWGTSQGTSGFFAGQVGAQYQFGSIVAGVEAMGTGFNGINKHFDSCNPVAACLAGTQMSGSVSNIASVGGRLGWVVDPWSRTAQWMPFISGGWAQAEVANTRYLLGAQNQVGSGSGTILQVQESTKDTVNGWYIGGGVNILAARNWMLGVEYRHYELDSVTSIPRTNLGVIDTNNKWKLDPSADTVALSLSYKFGGERGYGPLK